MFLWQVLCTIVYLFDLVGNKWPASCFIFKMWNLNIKSQSLSYLLNHKALWRWKANLTPNLPCQPPIRVLTLSRKHCFSRVLASRISTSKKRAPLLDFLVEDLDPMSLRFLWRGGHPSAGKRLPSMSLHTANSPRGGVHKRTRVTIPVRFSVSMLYMWPTPGQQKGVLLRRSKFVWHSEKRNCSCDGVGSRLNWSRSAHWRGSFLVCSAGCVPRCKLIAQGVELLPFPAKYKTKPRADLLTSSLWARQVIPGNFQRHRFLFSTLPPPLPRSFCSHFINHLWGGEGTRSSLQLFQHRTILRNLFGSNA